MEGALLYRRSIFLALAFLCLIMTGANFWLLRANKALRAGRATITQVRDGKVVDEVSGLGFDGHLVTLDTRDGKPTLLFVYSPTCPYCERNWPIWTGVLAGLDSSRVQSVVVDISATGTKEFIGRKKTGPALIIHRLDPKQLVDLDLNVTPQTILIGRDAKVQHVWTGVLSSKDLESLKDHLL